MGSGCSANEIKYWTEEELKENADALKNQGKAIDYVTKNLFYGIKVRISIA